MKDLQENRRVEGKLHTLLLICWFSSLLWVSNGSTIPWNLPQVLCLLSRVYVFSSMLKNPHLQQNTFTTKVRSNKNRNRFQFELLESIFCLWLQECLWPSLYDCLPYRLESDVETTSFIACFTNLHNCVSQFSVTNPGHIYICKTASGSSVKPWLKYTTHMACLRIILLRTQQLWNWSWDFILIPR